MAVLQGMKSFGSLMYQVLYSVVFTARKKIPCKGESRQRDEGVAMVLSVEVDASKSGGGLWKA